HTRQPHRMKIQVRYDNRKVSVQEILRNQVRNDAGRHEMRADGDMRIELANELYQRTGIQAVQHQAHSVGLPWFVALLIPPSQEFRSVLDKACIKLRIEIPEQLIGEIKRVAMHHLADFRMFFKDLGERLASSDMAGSRAGRNDQN